MKSLPIALLALVLALSGCSSSPSVEEQTKLIEYEACLEDENALTLLGWQMSGYSPTDRRQEIKKENKLFVDFTIENCSKYRP